MKIHLYEKPRVFHIKEGNVTISDYGKINLEPNELVSFRTPSGSECDFVAKEWGFYPTSSPNNRMKKEGFKTALVRNKNNKIQLNVVEEDKMDLYKSYLLSHYVPLKIVCWLDELDASQLDAIENALKKGEK